MRLTHEVSLPLESNRLREFCAPIHLSTQTVPEPTLEPDQVMIDIKATGLGYVDALMVAGLYQIKPPLPFIPGNEIAGVICEVGTDVSQISVGDRVLAMPSRGGLAEKIAVRADTCIPIPDRASFEAAAAFWSIIAPPTMDSSPSGK